MVNNNATALDTRDGPVMNGKNPPDPGREAVRQGSAGMWEFIGDGD